jgi:hypothetical protein
MVAPFHSKEYATCARVQPCAAEETSNNPLLFVIPAKAGIQVAVPQDQNGFPLSRE